MRNTKKAIDQAQRAVNQDLDEFLHKLNHDARSKAARVKGLLGLALSDCPPGPHSEYVRKAMASNDELLDLFAAANAEAHGLRKEGADET